MVIKIAVFGICVSLINSLLKRYSEHSAMFVQIAFVILVVSFVINELKYFFDRLAQYVNYIEAGEEFIADLIKGALICLLTDVSHNMCKESGNATVGEIISFSGKAALVYIAYPYISSVINVALSFVS